MTNNHRELVARAMFPAFWREEQNDPSRQYFQADMNRRYDTIQLADAAIKAHLAALREPTEAMIEAGNLVLAERDEELTDQRGWVRSVFQAMLKASGEEHAG